MTTKYRITFDGAEHSTVLAALRFYQRHLEQGNIAVDDGEFADIATNGYEHDPLSSGEIDDLCLKVNCDFEPVTTHA